MLFDFNWLTYIFIFFSQLDNFFHNFNFILYFALNYFNYRIYQLSSKEKRNILFKQVLKHKFIFNKYNENNEPIGIIIHKKMIPHFLIFNRSYHQDILTIIWVLYKFGIIYIIQRKKQRFKVQPYLEQYTELREMTLDPLHKHVSSEAGIFSCQT